MATLRWRLGVGALFAIGASFVLGSFAIGFSWFLALCLLTGFDAMLGKSYLNTRSPKTRASAGAMFVWGCAFSVAIFAAMTLCVAGVGGGPGRALGALMAASSLVGAMLFLFEAPAFMLISAAPATICLFAVPFIPSQPNATDILDGAIGAAFGVAGFLAYVARAALFNIKMLAGLQGANRAAIERQHEAESKRAEAEEANRAKSKFLAVMTHELRTPLNAVIGYAEMLQEDSASEGKLQAAADAGKIEQSARHLLGLIDQILNLSSIDAGHDTITPCDVDVRRLLEEAIAANEENARLAGDRISLRVGAGAERAYTDGAKLGVCVAAVLANAVKFTAAGLIAINAERECRADGDWLSISISDTGCGIAAQDLPLIFLPFTQIDASSTRAKGGMGLGLAIAQRMAHAIGGEVTASSQVGKGSTFTLAAPLRLAPPRTEGVRDLFGAAA